MSNSHDFLRSKRFLPLLLVQFLEAFNINLYKNALFILVTFHVSAKTFTSIGGGILILPYLLFSVIAGQLADKYEKTQLIRIIKIIEVGLMFTAGWVLVPEQTFFIYFILFCLGTHGTFLSPIKYAILPDLLTKNDLVLGNAWIEASTFLAILIGTILGGILIQLQEGVLWVSCILMISSLLGLWSSLYIPRTLPKAPSLKIDWNLIAKTQALFIYAWKDQQIGCSIWGISWVWFVGVTFLTLFPSFAKDTLHAEAGLVTLFLTLFSLGVGIGSVACGRLMRAKLRINYVPAACFVMALPMVDLWFASHSWVVLGKGVTTVTLFLSYFAGFRIAFDLLFTSICAGFYVVPLYTLLQTLSEDTHRARILACNNIVNALWMVASALITGALLSIGFHAEMIFALVGILSIGMAFYMRVLIPKKER